MILSLSESEDHIRCPPCDTRRDSDARQSRGLHLASPSLPSHMAPDLNMAAERPRSMAHMPSMAQTLRRAALSDLKALAGDEAALKGPQTYPLAKGCHMLQLQQQLQQGPQSDNLRPMRSQGMDDDDDARGARAGGPPPCATRPGADHTSTHAPFPARHKVKGAWGGKHSE